MRIVIDMQGAQTASRTRGIGRHSRSLAAAIARGAGGHEVHLALSGLFPETIESIRGVFEGLIPQNQIHVWEALDRVRFLDPTSGWRRQAAERLREGFLANLNPDVVHISSLFEGYGDDAVSSIGVLQPGLSASVTLYDLIPLVYRDSYFKDIYLLNPGYGDWYERKLDDLRRANLWLSISQFSRQEGIERLGLPDEWVVNVSAAADPCFRPMMMRSEVATALRHRYGLVRPFVMCAGGADHHKNVDRLIRAYSMLPNDVRGAHHLVIVSAMQPGEREDLERSASRVGLRAGELVLTGFVTEEDLVALYNLSTAVILPSVHEGFGLPALEAMACGTPVIGASTSSLPEVIGRADALFDPGSEDSIASKLNEVLTDERFRLDLKHHGPEQAKLFSWDRSARLAIEAFERLHAEKVAWADQRVARGRGFTARPRLAYVSPVPPERTGIADYSAELLPELARYYQIDVVIDQSSVTDPWVRANCGIRSAAWFDGHAHQYDRILYHFGNSPFHQHMFGLLERHPGTVVLHDFFLSGVIAHMDVSGQWPNAWARGLYESHGYPAVPARFEATDLQKVIYAYPCNLAVVQQAVGMIVHSEFSRQLAGQWYGTGVAEDWVVIPQPRRVLRDPTRSNARTALGLKGSDFMVCTFGMLDPTKLDQCLLRSWLASSLAIDEDCLLVFVGENHGGDYGAQLRNVIRESERKRRIHITGFVSAEEYRQYLAAADLAVQLRTNTRGETSRATLDCMSYGLPTVVNAHGWLGELPTASVCQLPDRFQSDELVGALEYLRQHPEERTVLGETAEMYMREHHTPRGVADRYMQAIEGFYSGNSGLRARLVDSLVRMEAAPDNGDPGAWVGLAEAITVDIPLAQPKRQLFVDVSVVAQSDLKTGIERVTRSVLKELLSHPPEGYRVEPVYAVIGETYRYARRFTMGLLNCPGDGMVDEAVELRSGDGFLGLDWAPDRIPIHTRFLSRLRQLGGRVHFVVYDLLPIRHPEWFPVGMDEIVKIWLQAISQQDGALCISRATAEDLSAWLEETQPERQTPYRISWFRSGSDINASVPTTGLPPDFEATLTHIKSAPSILMVGTLEPRKGHAQALGAFEQLWEQGVNAHLVIVGKQGWMVGELVERLRSHPEAGRRLFWLEGVSDEALIRIYGAATGVLVASQGEGFCLPLVEAAQEGRPILVRDIPVIRELVGEHATYFSGDTPKDLAEALKAWLYALEESRMALPGDMPIHTWADTAREVVSLLENPEDSRWISPKTRDHRGDQSHGFSPPAKG